MFSDELILIFSGISEQIADQRRLVQIAKQIDPRLPNSMVADHRILTSYFRNNHRLYDWMNAVLKNISTANIPGIRNFLYQLEKINIFYNHNTRCLERLDKPEARKANWGLLSEGDSAYVALSRIKLENPKSVNSTTQENFYHFVRNIIPKNYGRIWNEKSGNITAGYYPGDKVTFCIESAFSILLNAIFFNLDLPEENFLRIRISCAVDFINYSHDTKYISGEVIKKINALENYMQYHSIIIPESMFLQLEEKHQPFFKVTGIVDPEPIYQFVYGIGN